MTGLQKGLASGTVTFLFTDVEGSTLLWERDQSAMSVAMEQHDVLLRQAIEHNGGYVFTTAGDSFAAAFQRTSDAAAAAIAIDRSHAAQDWPGED